MWWTMLSVIEVAYVVVLSIWILLEKRSPVATLAWILALGALPVFGFVLFYFLGPRRLLRKKVKRAYMRERVRENHARARSLAGREPLSIEAEQFTVLAERTGSACVESCEIVVIHTDARACYKAICDAIDRAKLHVHVEYYIFEPGDAAAPIRDALVRARQRKVEVRLLVDAVGSSGLTRDFLAPLHEAGAKVETFNPVFFARLRAPLNFRNHRKIVVCDGVVGFTGGVNVCDEYLGSADNLPWRDTHLELHGKAVRWLALAFLEDWSFASGELPKGPDYFRTSEPAAGSESQAASRYLAQVIPSGPDQPFESIKTAYFTAIAQAKERVWVTTPYFVPDEAILTALTTAALRGVDVRVLVPRRGDSLLVTLAARSYYDELLAAGAKVYEYVPAMLHAKTIVIDAGLAIVGTANMDNRSFRLNFEISVAVLSEEITQRLAAIFKEDLESSELVKRSRDAKLPLVSRVGEAAARLLSPVL